MSSVQVSQQWDYIQDQKAEIKRLHDETARLREALEQVRSLAHGDADKTICLINLSAIQRIVTGELKGETK